MATVWARPANLPPSLDWIALAVVAAIWGAAFFVLGVLVVTLTFDEVSLDALPRSASSPTPRSTLPALLLTPLVHVGIEPLFTVTPATPAPQPRATPAATRRPPVIIVVPTPAK